MKIKPFGQKFIDGDEAHNANVREDYAKDLERQFEEHDLPVPNMDLFPGQTHKGNGRYYRSEKYANGRIIGHSFGEAARALLGRITRDDIHAMRVMTALHEAAHHVCYEIGARSRVLESQTKYDDDHKARFGERAFRLRKMPE